MTNEKAYQIRQILDLSNAFGPSGMEDEVRSIARKALPFCHFKTDSMGNLFITTDDLQSPKILLDAHMDEIGFMIQHIHANGTMSFLPIGGWNPREIYGQRVLILSSSGKKIPAICGTRPVHYTRSDCHDYKDSMKDLYLDVGTTSRQETLDLGIEPGCFAVPATQSQWHNDTQVFSGKAFDDRVGCAALIETMIRLYKNYELDYTTAVLSTQEEVGERGAQAALKHIKAQCCICFEGCPADDTFEEEEHIQSGLKRGPMIRARDRSMITHPRFLSFARKVARDKNLPLQIGVREGGGTNGGTYHVHDIPTIVIGIPVRYAHGHIGYCSWTDYDNAVKLAVEIVTSLNQYFKTSQDKEDIIMVKKFKMIMENGKEISGELYPEKAPKTVENFETLANKGFYDGLTFHRVIPGFMIQGGDPAGNGTGGPGHTIHGEFASNGFTQNDLKHTRGVLSMARTMAPNSAGSQFFIMHADAPHLDGDYAAFGKVTGGMDAVDEIAATRTGIANKPVKPQVIKSIRVYDEEK